MAKQKGSINKSKEIRILLQANPKMTAKEVVAALAEKRIKVSEALVYYQKGRMKGRKSRRKHLQAAATVASANGSGDPLATILKVKHLAANVGGLKKLKALVDALSE